jgi:hypothetical protein
MEKHLDVVKRTIELSESCVEALEHIKLRINEGAFEETIRLMDDLMNAIHQIEVSMYGYLDKLPKNDIEERTIQLRNAMELVVSAYEQRESVKASEFIQLNLYPCFNSWKAEIERVLHPYVLS